MMSALSSMPIDSRTTSGPAPALTFGSSDNCRCVVEADCSPAAREGAEVDEVEIRAVAVAAEPMANGRWQMADAVVCLHRL